MTDPTTLPPHRTLLSAPSRAGDGATGTTDDGALLRLAIWLAEVSAEAARDATAPAGDATPTALAPRLAREAEQPVPEVLS
jgi:hypothetical protein